MKCQIKYLLFFPLILIVNSKPFNEADYPSRILNRNYEGFVNNIQADNVANVPIVHHGNTMKNNIRNTGIKYANLGANNAVQDAGTKDNRQSLDKGNEILEPSENTFYDINELYTPLVNIYRSYPVDLYHQQQLINDVQQQSFKLEESKLLDALFSIESVPFPNPLFLLSEPSPLNHQQQHSSVTNPTTNLRRFSFQMPAFPSFEQSFNPLFGNSFSVPSFTQSNTIPPFSQNTGIPSYSSNNAYQPFSQGGNFYSTPRSKDFSSYSAFDGFPFLSQGWNFPSLPSMDLVFPNLDFTFLDMKSVFKSTFDPKRFIPEIVQDDMMDQNGKVPDLIQLGKNNTNIKSSNQYGIVQISCDNVSDKCGNFRKTELPLIMTTEYPETVETSTLPEETTTLYDEITESTNEYLNE